MNDTLNKQFYKLQRTVADEGAEREREGRVGISANAWTVTMGGMQGVTCFYPT